MSSIEKFKQDFKKQIKDSGYSYDQIYNCDETGLNYKMLPSKTLASRQEKSSPGHKRSKERLTVMACSNAFGKHKLPLMVIGKAARPRALKDISPKALLVYYKSQESAWMDASLFANWFKEKFMPSVTKFLKRNGFPIKAILLMNNAPPHPGEELHVGNFVVKFFPPNVTRIMQPMEQSVLENIKKNYRRLYLEHVLEYTEKEEDIISAIRKITLKNVIYWVSQAWDSTIKKSWTKVIDNENYDSEDDIPLSELALKFRSRGEMSSSNFDIETEEEQNLFELLQNLKGCENMTRQDVVEWVTVDDLEEEMSIEELTNAFQETEKSDDDDDEAVDEQPLTKISHQEGFASLEKALRYIKQQSEATPADLLLLNRWRIWQREKEDAI